MVLCCVPGKGRGSLPLAPHSKPIFSRLYLILLYLVIFVCAGLVLPSQQSLIGPDIINQESSSDMTVKEFQNVTMKCRASGSPKPLISWVREDGIEIDTSVKTETDVLHIPNVSRRYMGAYLCIASNGVPPAVSKRIFLQVQFHPVLWIRTPIESVAQGEDVTLECHVEGFPLPITYWTDEKGQMIPSRKDWRFDSIVEVNGYKTYMRLTIKNVQLEDYMTYGCFAKNNLGETNGYIKVYDEDEDDKEEKEEEDDKAAKDIQNDKSKGEVPSSGVRSLEVPPHADRYTNQTLTCNYEKEKLYALKWYFNDEEFFRYLPNEIPNLMTYENPYFEVIEAESDTEKVVLKEVDLSASGEYKCEVTQEWPTFAMTSKSSNMTVVVIPHVQPNISGYTGVHYKVGGSVLLNCTAAPSMPPADLIWLINNKGALKEYVHHYGHFKTKDGLLISKLGLNFNLSKSNFINGELRLKCIATIGTLYAKSNEVSQKEPTAAAAAVPTEGYLTTAGGTSLHWQIKSISVFILLLVSLLW